jgi:hypothetical protein
MIFDRLARIDERAVLGMGFGLGVVGSGAVLTVTHNGKGMSDGGANLAFGLIGGATAAIAIPVLINGAMPKHGPYASVATSDAAENVTKGWRDLKWSQKSARLAVLGAGEAAGVYLGALVISSVTGTHYQQGPFASAVEAPERHSKELKRAALFGGAVFLAGSLLSLKANKHAATRIAGVVASAAGGAFGAWFGANSLGISSPHATYTLHPPQSMTVDQLVNEYMKIHDTNHDHKITLAEENHDGNFVELTGSTYNGTVATRKQIAADFHAADSNHDNHLDMDTSMGGENDEWSQFKEMYRLPDP